MPLPQSARELSADLEDVQTAIDALPSTPLEADLPDIVAIVASLQVITTTIASILATTRINQ